MWLNMLLAVLIGQAYIVEHFKQIFALYKFWDVRVKILI